MQLHNEHRPLLIVGPDNTVNDTFSIARKSFPRRKIEKLIIPTKDYYIFDLTSLQEYSATDWNVCTSVNEFYLNDVRREFHNIISSFGFLEESVISPQAYVHEDAHLGEGCIIHSGCAIDSGSIVGKKGLLRPNVAIGEGCSIGDFITLESNVSLRELVTIGTNTIVSANSSIARAVEIGDYCYLNQSRQYFTSIPDHTSISLLFPHPVRAYFSKTLTQNN